MNENSKYTRIRRFKYGTNAVILTLSIIGIVIILNAIVTKYTKQFDITENKRFSLSAQTLNVLKKLDKNVFIYIFSKEGGQGNELLDDLIKQYIRHTKFIKVRAVDTDRNPSLAEKYNVRDYGVIVFECGKSKSQITKNDLFDFDFGSMGHEEDPKFNGEQVFTSNIIKVSSANKKTVYFLVGHGERLVGDMEDGGYYRIQDYILKENYDVKSINLSINPVIPAKDSILVVAGSKSSLLEREEKIIDSYLENGGKVLFLMDPQRAKGIDRLLKKWSVTIGDDIIIDSGRSYFYDPLTPIPQYLSHPITDDLIQIKAGVILPGVRSVRKSSDDRPDLNIRPLLETSDKSWAETNLISSKAEFNQNEDIKGPVTIGLAIEKKKEPAADTTEIDATKPEGKEDSADLRMVIIGDSDFASNRMINSQGNIDLFMNTINWLAGEIDKISIRPKVLNIKKIELTKNQSKFILLLTIAGIPLLIVAIGGVIWWRRRSL